MLLDRATLTEKARVQTDPDARSRRSPSRARLLPILGIGHVEAIHVCDCELQQ